MSSYYPPAHPIVGVLGGMGPAATIELMRRVMEATPAADDADHIHLLVDQNPKVPSRIDALIDGIGPSPLDELVRMAKGLESAGATMLAIACNTAHGYAADIASAVRIPLLDMVTLTAGAVARRPLSRRRIGMLASTAVLQLGLYERAFEAFGIETRYPDDQAEIMAIIKAVKKEGATAGLRSRFDVVARRLIAGDVDFLVIACTELSLLVDGLDADLAKIDALDVLVATIVERTRPHGR
ncbi:amino acid racemase [Mesorhizobium sp. WSM4884]|uniref:aspartate/glutamate racemase family protein n=1 Tax=Mesorhizobium sp. WSM4884 TaxID=3038542 RepID=UPI0024163788|nr:amino acid racemase [Mesorhizobium sp. WSM4884]MDG4882090.1 amino acid racemase [Mesorhizobium sp. WSM4884]